MRRFDKKNNIEKANILTEERHLTDKSYSEEHQSTEFKNSQVVKNKIKSKGDELLIKYPIVIYNEWDLNNSEEESAKNRLGNPTKYDSLDSVQVINNYQMDLLKKGKFGPSAYFNSTMNMIKQVEVTLINGVNSNLLSKGQELITKDGFHSIVTIMKNTIDVSNDFTPEEKLKLIQMVITYFKGFIQTIKD